LAGVFAEALFDPDFRPGSSADEFVKGAGIIAQVARKLRHSDPERLWYEVVGDLTATLKTHEAIVREIADVLMRCGSISGSRLQRALAGVQPATSLQSV
jgi:hypothetical protein